MVCIIWNPDFSKFHYYYYRPPTRIWTNSQVLKNRPHFSKIVCKKWVVIRMMLKNGTMGQSSAVNLWEMRWREVGFERLVNNVSDGVTFLPLWVNLFQLVNWTFKKYIFGMSWEFSIFCPSYFFVERQLESYDNPKWT